MLNKIIQHGHQIVHIQVAESAVLPKRNRQTEQRFANSVGNKTDFPIFVFAKNTKNVQIHHMRDGFNALMHHIFAKTVVIFPHAAADFFFAHQAVVRRHVVHRAAAQVNHPAKTVRVAGQVFKHTHVGVKQVARVFCVAVAGLGSRVDDGIKFMRGKIRIHRLRIRQV